MTFLVLIAYLLGGIATWIGVDAYERITRSTPRRIRARIAEHKAGSYIGCYECRAGRPCETYKTLLAGGYWENEEVPPVKRLVIAVFWPVTVPAVGVAFPLSKTADKVVSHMLVRQREQEARREALAREVANAEQEVEDLLAVDDLLKPKKGEPAKKEAGTR